MECNHPECSKSVYSICKTCTPSEAHFCKRHGVAHSSEFEHIVEKINRRFKRIMIKAELKKCISRILEETHQIISEINRISKEVINKLRETSQNLRKLKDLELIGFNKKIYSNVMKEMAEMAEIKLENNCDLNATGKIYLEFNKSTLNDKIIIIKETWSSFTLTDKIDNLMLSNDRRFLFICIFDLGKKNQIVYLKRQ